MRRLFTLVAASALLASAPAADDLPRPAADEPMDFEPGLLPDLIATPAPTGSVSKIEAAIERAKKSAASGERLFRAGIIAKVEAERRVLKVIRLNSDFAKARAEAARLELAEKRAEFDAGKLSKEQLAATQTSADTASEAAAAATVAWERAELAAAELHLSRQRKLLAAGVGSKSMVARAQSQVAAMKSRAAPPRTPDAN